MIIEIGLSANLGLILKGALFEKPYQLSSRPGKLPNLKLHLVGSIAASTSFYFGENAKSIISTSRPVAFTSIIAHNTISTV